MELSVGWFTPEVIEKKTDRLREQRSRRRKVWLRRDAERDVRC